MSTVHFLWKLKIFEFLKYFLEIDLTNLGNMLIWEKKKFCLEKSFWSFVNWRSWHRISNNIYHGIHFVFVSTKRLLLIIHAAFTYGCVYIFQNCFRVDPFLFSFSFSFSFLSPFRSKNAILVKYFMTNNLNKHQWCRQRSRFFFSSDSFALIRFQIVRGNHRFEIWSDSLRNKCCKHSLAFWIIRSDFIWTSQNANKVKPVNFRHPSVFNPNWISKQSQQTQNPLSTQSEQWRWWKIVGMHITDAGSAE